MFHGSGGGGSGGGGSGGAGSHAAESATDRIDYPVVRVAPEETKDFYADPTAVFQSFAALMPYLSERGPHFSKLAEGAWKNVYVVNSNPGLVLSVPHLKVLDNKNAQKNLQWSLVQLTRKKEITAVLICSLLKTPKPPAPPTRLIYVIAYIHARKPGIDLYCTLYPKAPEKEPEEAMRLQMVYAIIKALYVYHQVDRLAHLDLKPENVIFDKDTGTAHLVDFDFSHPCEPKEAIPNMRRGTPLYLAPEVFRDGVASLRADLFALGCIILEILAPDIFQAYIQAPCEAHKIIDYASLERLPVRILSLDSKQNVLLKRMLAINHEVRPNIEDIHTALVPKDQQLRGSLGGAKAHEWLEISDEVAALQEKYRAEMQPTPRQAHITAAFAAANALLDSIQDRLDTIGENNVENSAQYAALQRLRSGIDNVTGETPSEYLANAITAKLPDWTAELAGILSTPPKAPADLSLHFVGTLTMSSPLPVISDEAALRST